jgi:hypothetical protein
VIWAPPRSRKNMTPLDRLPSDPNRAESHILATMPDWLQPFATNQPLSVTVAAVRSLLEGGPLNPWVWQALAWSARIFVAFFLVAVHLYRNITTHFLGS